MVSVLGNRTGHAPLATESLTVALSHCVHRWTIGTDRDTLPVIGTPGIGWTRLAEWVQPYPSAVLSTGVWCQGVSHRLSLRRRGLPCRLHRVALRHFARDGLPILAEEGWMHLSICTTSETLEEARAVIGAFIRWSGRPLPAASQCAKMVLKRLVDHLRRRHPHGRG